MGSLDDVLKKAYSPDKLAKVAATPSGLSGWLPSPSRDWLVKLRQWGSEVLDPRALQSFKARRETRMVELEKNGLKPERRAQLERETREHAADIARAFVGRCIDGGETLFDLEFLFQDGKPVDPTLLCRRLLVPKVWRRDVDVCRYCGHPAVDHWGDNCGVCNFEMGGINGVSSEQHLPGCDCVSMGLPDDWVLPAHKEGADAPVRTAA